MVERSRKTPLEPQQIPGGKGQCGIAQGSEACLKDHEALEIGAVVEDMPSARRHGTAQGWNHR